MMEIVLVIIAATLIGGGFFFAFYLGVKEGEKHKASDAVELTEDNKKAMQELFEWLSYGGK